MEYKTPMAYLSKLVKSFYWTHAFNVHSGNIPKVIMIQYTKIPRVMISLP